MSAHLPPVQSNEQPSVPHKRSRRTFLRAGTCVAAALLASGCTAIRTGQPETSLDARRSRGDPQLEVTQLVYQDWRNDWFPGMVEEMLDRFHEQNPSIRVFFTPDPPNLEDSMLASMMAGTAPDLFQGCCTFFPIWAQAGYTLDLQPWVDLTFSPSAVAEWDGAQYEALRLSNGHRFGLPKYHGGLALYFNKNLFDERNIEHPDYSWDHDDYAEAMRALTRDRSGNGLTDLWGSMLDLSWDRVQVHVNGWGGHLIHPRNPKSCTLDDSPTLKALEWLRARMWDEKVMATRLDVHNMSTRSAFVNQRVAMIEEGSWALKEILSGTSFPIGVAPFPSGPKKRVTLGTTDGFGIFAETLYPEACWKLMAFLTNAAYGRAMMRANFLQPARRSLVDEWIDAVLQQFPARITQEDLAAFADGHRNGYSVTIEIGSNMAEIQQHTYAQWEQIFTLGTAPVHKMRQVCQRIDALLSDLEEGNPRIPR